MLMQAKSSKLVLTVLMLGVAGLSSLSGASSAEAGAKLDDVQISLRWRGDHRPPPPPPGVRRDGPRRHWRHRVGGPRGHWGFHSPRRHCPPPPHHHPHHCR